MAGRTLGPVLMLVGLWSFASWAQSFSTNVSDDVFSGEAVVCVATNVPSAVEVDPLTEIARQTLIEPVTLSDSPDVRLMETATTIFMSDGSRLRTVLSSYTELGSGLQYKDERGQWQVSRVSVEEKSGGGLAFKQLPVKYDFAPSANQRAVLTEQHASGSARSAVSALSYYDPASGKSRLFAWVQPAQAQAFNGGVFYPSCFKGADADIVYKVHPWGLEQDIVLFGDLPLPSSLGLDDETTVLCVWTELLDVDERTAKRPEGVEVSVPSPAPLRVFTEDSVSPLYNLQRCYAYVEDKSLTFGGRDRASEQVVNMRLFTVEGRTFLSEEVPVSALLKSANHLFAKKTDDGESRTVLETPPLRPEQCKEEPRLAKARSRTLPGYVIDYINYSGTLTNSFTFQSHQTYFISSPLTFDGTNVVLTVEPSCYVKLATNASISFINGARLVTKSHGLTPALFTSVYDTNGAGEVISGYVGNPATNKYPAAFIFQSTTNKIEGVQIKYAQCALRFESYVSARQEVRASRFADCNRAADVLAATNEVLFQNCLFQNLSQGVYATTNAVSIINSTFDGISQWAVFITNAVRQVSLQNNLFAASTNQVAAGPTNALLMAYNAFYCSASNRVGSAALLLSNAPFATGAQGAHYLSATSGLVNAGQGSATNWGLYHYTTSTAHTKETNSLVDIGFHYAVTADTDGDGLYDFIEDSNGNGLWDPSLEGSSWTQADTDSDGISDGAELARGTDPADSNSCLITLYVSLYNGGHVSPFLSWANAATTIQAAVDVAYPGDLILVADGFYATGGRTKPGLRQSRLVIDKPVTVRSVSGPNNTYIRGELPSDSGGPGMRAVYMTNNAVLDGFMIFSGSAVSNVNGDLIQDYYGGGVWCEDNSALLTNCMVLWNEARFGGGLHRGTARNCTLAGNAAHVYGGGAYESRLYGCEVSGNWGSERGGGAYEADLVACSIASNFSVMGGGFYGGTASNSTISHNTGYWQGGGVDGAATLDQCTINENQAVYGGGVYGFGSEVRRSVLSSNQAFQGGGAYGGDFYHCTFRGNRADWDAGSIWSGLGNCLVVENVAGYNAACSYGAIINCTVADNIATQAYGGAVGCWVINSILYHNTPDNHTASEISFSCVTPEAPGQGNITNQPAFTDRGQGYHLSLTSACVDAGETYSATSLIFDCDGEARVFGGVVDMGHDEGVDSDGDGMPDWWELEQGMNPLVAEWPLTVPFTDECDTAEHFHSLFGAQVSATNGEATLVRHDPSDGGVCWPLKDGARFIQLSALPYLRLQVTGLVHPEDQWIGSVALFDADYSACGVYSFQSSTSTLTNRIYDIESLVQTGSSSAVYYTLALRTAGAGQGIILNAVALAARPPQPPYPNGINEADSDGDGMLDDWEYAMGFNKLDSSDKYGNADGDSRSNLEEFLDGTNPNDFYSDIHTHCVSTNGGHITPFTGWANAATSIQAAVDVAMEGDLVAISNGLYRIGGRPLPGYALTNRVVITNAITVKSVNGAPVTTIMGAGPLGPSAVRCIYLGANAVLDGFTLASGCTLAGLGPDEDRSGGGVWCDSSGVVSNCVIAGNVAQNSGGGAYNGSLYDCTLSGNTANYGLRIPVYTGETTELLNPGFEDSALGCSLTGIVHWTSMGLNGGYITNAVVKEGARALKLIAPESIIAQSWPAVPGHLYSSSGYALTPSSEKLAGNSFVEGFVIIQYLNAASNVLLTYASQSFTTNTSADVWVRLAAEGIAPANAACGRTLVCLLGSSENFSGALYFDAISHSLLATGFVRTAGLLSNPGFDDGPFGNCRLLQNSNALPAWKWLGGPNAGFIVSSAFQSPGQSLALTAPSNSLIQDFTCQPGAVYKLNGFMYTPSSFKFATDGTTFGQFQLSFFVDGSSVPATTAFTAPFTASHPADTWIPFSVIATSPAAGSVTGRLTCVIARSSSSTDYDYDGVILMDDLAVTEIMGGGGAANAVLHNCMLEDNASLIGGGAFGGTLHNCLVKDNTAEMEGGGAHAGTLNNCTLAGNSAAYGGGVYGGTQYNCIAYFNTAAMGVNVHESTMAYSCTTPNPGGAGNISDDPQFAADGYHLLPTSPCIDQGDNLYAVGTMDIDEENRVLRGTIDMGADESAAFDTDGDGIIDEVEIHTDHTDPLDKYSVRPPDFLTARGPDIVDASTNRVLLKSVNIGGWLAHEQWMLGFQPGIVTNMIGSVTTNHMSEATLRELLVDNVDFAVTRLATNHNGAHPSLSMNGPGWAVYSHIGAFKNTYWVRYNIDGGVEGVSNMSVIIARGSSTGNPRIEVRLGNATGPHIGTLAVADTGAWDAWSQQSVALWSNVVGVQTVCLVGSTSGDDVGNVHLVRFYRDTNTRQLMDSFHQNYFTTNDIERLQGLGYNCLRVPFLADMIMNGTNFMETGWSKLDWVVSECQKRRMWCILDLHGTPGSQNWEDHSGQPKGLCNRLWKSVEYKNRMSNLWVKVADRYKTNSAVAGYDIMNEPESDASGTKVQIYSNSILPVLSTMYSAIRSKDTKHLVFMMSNFMYANMWNDLFACPAPASRGWSNVVYQFHVYEQVVYGRNEYDDSWFTTQKRICDDMIRAFTRFREQKNAPVFLGEFAPWNEQNFEYWIRQLQANDLHWAHWNYRTWGWDDTTSPEKGKTLWGLDYRSKATTNLMPNVLSDDFITLSNKFSQYNSTNYTANTHLQDVVARHAQNPELSKGKCDFYLNTFSGPDKQYLSAGWPWRKMATVGAPESFHIENRQARVFVNVGTLIMRFKSREEADARFLINDAVGSSFSVNVAGFNVGTPCATGAEARVVISAVRDSINKPINEYDTAGVIGLLEYEQSSDTVRLSLYAKDGGTNTFGTLLGTSDWVPFVSTKTFALQVSQNGASLSYNGINYCNGSLSNLELDEWPDGAVCAVEASQAPGAIVSYMEMDDFKAWRDDADRDVLYEDRFATYPNGVEVRAETEQLNVEDYYAASRKSGSYATNTQTFWIPKEWAGAGTWLSPRRDYHNGVRIPVSATNAIEVRAVYTDFANAAAKICLLPEYFPTEIYSEYAGSALYVDVERQTGNISFTARRHNGTTSRDDLQSSTVPYVNGQSISLQVTTNELHVFYGSSHVISVHQHGLSGFTNVYANGVWPHYEFRNTWTTNAYVLISDVVCQERASCGPP